MVFRSWTSVFDAGPTAKHHRVNVPRVTTAPTYVHVCDFLDWRKVQGPKSNHRAQRQFATASQSDRHYRHGDYYLSEIYLLPEHINNPQR